MSKFKVGDRVRRIGHTGIIHNCPIGHETVVDQLLGKDPYGFWYIAPDGDRQNSSNWGDWELVESPGPVRTVTRKEIITGVYGRISVSQQGGDEPRLLIALADLGGNVNMVHQGWSLDELSDAISNLTAIRDALQEQDK